MERLFWEHWECTTFSSRDLSLEHQGERRDEGNDGKISWEHAEMKRMMEFFFGNIENTPPFPAETWCWSIKEMKGMMERSLGNMLGLKEWWEGFFGNIENVPPFSSWYLLLEHQGEQSNEGNDGKISWEHAEMKRMMESFFGNIDNMPPFPAETCCGSVKENE